MQHVFQVAYVELWEQDDVFGYYTSYEKALDVLNRIEAARKACAGYSSWEEYPDGADEVDNSTIRVDTDGRYVITKIELNKPLDTWD